jgi:hypothetical protein
MKPPVALVIAEAIDAAAREGIATDAPSRELSAFVAQHLATEVVRLRRDASAASAGYARLPPTRPVRPPKARPPTAI